MNKNSELLVVYHVIKVFNCQKKFLVSFFWIESGLVDWEVLHELNFIHTVLAWQHLTPDVKRLHIFDCQKVQHSADLVLCNSDNVILAVRIRTHKQTRVWDLEQFKRRVEGVVWNLQNPVNDLTFLRELVLVLFFRGKTLLNIPPWFSLWYNLIESEESVFVVEVF